MPEPHSDLGLNFAMGRLSCATTVAGRKGVTS